MSGPVTSSGNSSGNSSGGSSGDSRDVSRARHRSGRRGRGVAGWVWVLPVVVVLLAALVAGWFTLIRDDPEDETPQCINGDLSLTAWVDPAAEVAARDLLEKYSATSPVVRDYCVHPVVEIRPTAEAAAAYNARTPGSAAVWFPVGDSAWSGVAGAPPDPPVVATTADGAPVSLVVFGSSGAVAEDSARAGADLLRTVDAG